MKAYTKMVKLEDYLYKIEYPSLDYEYAHKYFHNNYDLLSEGSCSAVYSSNGLFGKNLDLTYDESVSFIVINKFGTYDAIGVAGGIKRLDKEFVESGRPSRLYKILPFVINSGMNSAGVYAGLNIVPNGDAGETTGTNPDSLERINALMLVRYILDKCGSAREAIWKIQMADVYCPHTDERNEEYHLMIGDEKECFIVEFINNKTVVIPIIENKWMTNYYRDGAEFDSDGMVDWHTLTPHANGTHRSDIIAETFAGFDWITEDQMKELMRDKLRYTRTYEEPEWKDEFCGVYPSYGYGNLTQQILHTNPSAFDGIFNEAKSQYEERVRGLTDTWQTVTSTIYNIVDKTISVVADEGEEEHVFDIAGNELNQKIVKAPCGGLLFDESQFEMKATPDGTRYVGLIEKEAEPPIDLYLKTAKVEKTLLTIEDQDGTLIEYDPTPDFDKVVHVIEDETEWADIPTLLEEYTEVLYHFVGNKSIIDDDKVVRSYTFEGDLPYQQTYNHGGLNTYVFAGDVVGTYSFGADNFVDHVYELTVLIDEGATVAREVWLELDAKVEMDEEMPEDGGTYDRLVSELGVYNFVNNKTDEVMPEDGGSHDKLLSELGIYNFVNEQFYKLIYTYF